jgi:hypothetical protein
MLRNIQEQHAGSIRNVALLRMPIVLSNTLFQKADDSAYELTSEEAQKVINAFLAEGLEEIDGDVREQYRYEEFEVFQKNSKSLGTNDKLIFNDIELPKYTTTLFTIRYNR